MATPASALVGYAVLRSNYNADAPTYLENFQPFILSVLASSRENYLAKQRIAEMIRENFGITIPVHVVAKLIRRLNKQGATSPIGQEAISITESGRVRASGVAEQVVTYKRRQQELVQEFRKFVGHKYPHHAHLLTEDIGAALAEYFDKHAAPLLEQSLRGRTRPTATAQGLDFLVSSFVREIAENDQTRFAYVVEAAKGAMLASVLVLDTSGLSDSLNSLSIVLDTPVIMDALGFHGEIPQAAALQVLTLASSQGARLVTFEHVVGEVEGILESIEHALRPGYRSKSTAAGFLHFAETGHAPADLAILRRRLSSLLADVGVSTIARPDGYYQFGLDEAELERILQEKVGYTQDAARINDVYSLSAVQRLRKGTRDKAIEHCRFVMVTSNSNLVRASIEFDKGNRSFPLAITIEALASILWVRTPAAASDVPKQILLASAFAGMQPDPHLWAQYLNEIDKLEDNQTVTADEAIVLRSHHVSRETLMDETLGNLENLTLDSPLEALQRLKREVTQPLQQKLQELAQTTGEASQVAEHTTADWMKQVEAREQAEARVTNLEESNVSLETKLADIAQEEVGRRTRIDKVARQRACKKRVYIENGLRIVAGIVAIAACVIFIFFPEGRVGAAIGGIVGVFSIFVPLFPKPQELLDQWQDNSTEKTKRNLLENAGYDL